MNNENEKYKGIILAAGRGSRLMNITDDKPKCFVKINNKKLIDWQIYAFNKAGINDIYIITGYKSDMINFPNTIKIKNEEWDKSNMVCSLLKALDNLPPPFIVSYSDILVSHSLVKQLLNSEGEFVITYDKDWRSLWEKRFRNPLEDAETFKINNKEEITSIGNKTDNINEIQGQYMGLFKICGSAANWIRTVISNDMSLRYSLDMTKLIQILIDKGLTINGLCTCGNWCEIDNEADIKLAETLMNQGTLVLD